jgi:Pyruvate/2-oxoacid:ferredoxin oxidoreductase gamma subunit
MVGAFAGATGILKLETLKETAEEFFNGALAEKNKLLIEEAYNQMKVMCR